MDLPIKYNLKSRVIKVNYNLEFVFRRITINSITIMFINIITISFYAINNNTFHLCWFSTAVQQIPTNSDLNNTTYDLAGYCPRHQGMAWLFPLLRFHQAEIHKVAVSPKAAVLLRLGSSSKLTSAHRIQFPCSCRTEFSCWLLLGSARDLTGQTQDMQSLPWAICNTVYFFMATGKVLSSVSDFYIFSKCLPD